ncbi:hypothetical protein [Roseateles sp. P5_D6]
MTTENESLPEFLARSEAFKSLRAEAHVAASLKKIGWRTTHSPYYLDDKTGKPRELDVAATMHWTKRRKSGDIWVRVNVFIEVKSNSDFHILFAGPAATPSSFDKNEYWIGYSEATSQKLEERLARFGLSRQEIFNFLHLVEKIAFPRNSMRTSPLRVRPPTIDHCFTAFRETNGKTEKDLDNSVLWRAASALRSAVRSTQLERMDGFAFDVGTDLEVARRHERPFETAMGAIDRETCSLVLYLPVVVIESRIWHAKAEGPEELKWARLIQYGTFGHQQDWVDVVALKNLEEYLDFQFAYFERAFRKARAKR